MPELDTVFFLQRLSLESCLFLQLLFTYQQINASNFIFSCTPYNSYESALCFSLQCVFHNTIHFACNFFVTWHNCVVELCLNYIIIKCSFKDINKQMNNSNGYILFSFHLFYIYVVVVVVKTILILVMVNSNSAICVHFWYGRFLPFLCSVSTCKSDAVLSCTIQIIWPV